MKASHDIAWQNWLSWHSANALGLLFFFHFHPRRRGKWLVAFFHSQKTCKMQKMAGPEAAEVWWDRAREPSLHPSYLRGGFVTLQVEEVTWEGKGGCSWTTLTNSSVRKGFLQLLWGNYPISSKTSEQVNTSWPSRRRAESPFMPWTMGKLSQVKPASSISKKKNLLLRRNRQNTTSQSLGMCFRLQIPGKKGLLS